MPDWFAVVAGWMNLVFGCLGLWRGVTLLLSGGTKARDSTGAPGRLVLVESGGLILLGAALLLGGGWAYLILPAVVLMTIGEARRISSWLHRRRCRLSLPDRNDERADTCPVSPRSSADQDAPDK